VTQQQNRNSNSNSELEAALAGLHLPAGITIRTWHEEDFPAIQQLTQAEGWPTSTQRPTEMLAAWHNSWPTLVAIADEQVVGFVRAFSDKHITTYIIELLVADGWRGQHVGHALLDACHALYPRARLEVQSTETSASFYQTYGFRDLGQGHRKSFV
jgi:ribosomal protein S18 acetylase RimI-like enzyme